MCSAYTYKQHNNRKKKLKVTKLKHSIVLYILGKILAKNKSRIKIPNKDFI